MTHVGRSIIGLGLLATVLTIVILAQTSPVRSAPATFTVDSTGNAGDFSSGDGWCDTDDSVGDGPCTLRAAVQEANATMDLDTIEFDIAGVGPHTIALDSGLPYISEPVIIDGTSEPDFAGAPVIELNGINAGAGVNGLTIDAGGSTVKGLVINRFMGHGIALRVSGGNVIAGNYIGTDVTGTITDPNQFVSGDEYGNLKAGVYIEGTSSNTIGGSNTDDDGDGFFNEDPVDGVDNDGDQNEDGTQGSHGGIQCSDYIDNDGDTDTDLDDSDCVSGIYVDEDPLDVSTEGGNLISGQGRSLVSATDGNGVWIDGVRKLVGLAAGLHPFSPGVTNAENEQRLRRHEHVTLAADLRKKVVAMLLHREALRHLHGGPELVLSTMVDGVGCADDHVSTERVLTEHEIEGFL